MRNIQIIRNVGNHLVAIVAEKGYFRIDDAVFTATLPVAVVHQQNRVGGHFHLGRKVVHIS